jgi:hypothetical protein
MADLSLIVLCKAVPFCYSGLIDPIIGPLLKEGFDELGYYCDNHSLI